MRLAQMLTAALNKFVPGQWEENPGDGAFYGPSENTRHIHKTPSVLITNWLALEIDITISDALKRPFQCATIQLDFNLPVQFKLSYRTGETGSADKPEGSDPNSKELDVDRARPVMIHRAILGSLERFIAIITEHFGGKW